MTQISSLLYNIKDQLEIIGKNTKVNKFGTTI